MDDAECKLDEDIHHYLGSEGKIEWGPMSFEGEMHFLMAIDGAFTHSKRSFSCKGANELGLKASSRPQLRNLNTQQALLFQLA